MEYRDLGATGLCVSAVGLGAGQLGDHALDEAAAGRLLNGALDLGITLIDTARGYGLSEQRIGRHVAHRRDEFVLSTKVGYSVPGHGDWSYGAVLVGIDEARTSLRSDVLDVVHLHSCDVDMLAAGGAIDALAEARHRGWIRVAAYSGENEPLGWAVDGGRFGSVEFSVNLCDQRVIDDQLTRAHQRGLGVIAKRPLANAPWRHEQRPSGMYVEPYWERWQAMRPPMRGLPRDEVALRFAAHQPGVCAVITGTTTPEHLARNVEVVSRGPLAPDHVAELRAAFTAADPGTWAGQV